MVAVTVLVVVVGILVLLGYVVHRARPTRFKLNAGLWKVLTLNVEVDSAPGTSVEKPPDGEPRELTEGKHRALPDGKSAPR
jgi:hypothetical protein